MIFKKVTNLRTTCYRTVVLRFMEQAAKASPLSPIGPRDWETALPQAVAIIRAANERSRVGRDAMVSFAGTGKSPLLDATQDALDEVLSETVQTWRDRLTHISQDVRWHLFMEKDEHGAGDYIRTMAIMRMGRKGYVCRLAAKPIERNTEPKAEDSRTTINLMHFLHQVARYMYDQGVSLLYDQTYPGSYLVKNYMAMGFERLQGMDRIRFRAEFLPILEGFGLNPPDDMIDLRLELSSINATTNRILREAYRKEDKAKSESHAAQAGDANDLRYATFTRN